MPIKNLFLITISVFLSCDTGKLTSICTLPKELNEVSGIAISTTSNLLWMIEDSGNKDHIYGISPKGKIIKDINLNKKVKNIDWEDLTSDNLGNLYIGDFGNNNYKKRNYTIYKVALHSVESDENVMTEKITFDLPKQSKPQDFEAFFLKEDFFYLFSKKQHKTTVWKVPNRTGKHTALYIDSYQFEGKNNPITGADITADGGTIALLNHDKIWIISDFDNDQFFGGNITVFPFDHNSQKEGVCFINNTTLYIADERTKNEGGKLYVFDVPRSF